MNPIAVLSLLVSMLLLLAFPSAGAVTNPSFEADGAAFSFAQQTPTGWAVSITGSGGFKGKIASFGATDGNYVAQLFINVSGAASTDGSTELRQDVDLTGVDVLAFDAQLAAPSAWNPGVQAEFRIDDVIVWSRNALAVLPGEVVDVSAYSGVHEIEFRLSTTVTGSSTGGHNFFVDHVREVQPPPRLTSLRAEPLVIRAGLDTFALTLTVSDSAVSEVQIDLGASLTQGGGAAGITSFRDDGTGGDVTAGDGVFTSTGIGLASTPGSSGVRSVRTTSVDYLYPSAPTFSNTEDVALSLRYIDAALALPGYVDHAADVRSTPYVTSIVQGAIGAFPDLNLDRRQLANRYYVFHPDDLDFLFVDYAFNTSGAYGRFSNIRNDVVGTGRPLDDDSADYGSASVLRGVVTTTQGGARDFGLLNHELLHYWATHVDPSLDLGSGHWDVIERPSSGFGSAYAFDTLEVVSGNTYRGVEDPVPDQGLFSDLELYLMGLEPEANVSSPIDTLVNPVFQSSQPIGGGATEYFFTADSLRSVAMSEIIAADGVRSPAWPNSPTHFKGRLIVAYDRLLTDVELAFYDFSMREYEKETSSEGLTFAAATGGRGSIELPEPGLGIGVFVGLLTLCGIRGRAAVDP